MLSAEIAVGKCERDAWSVVSLDNAGGLVPPGSSDVTGISFVDWLRYFLLTWIPGRATASWMSEAVGASSQPRLMFKKEPDAWQRRARDKNSHRHESKRKEKHLSMSSELETLLRVSLRNLRRKILANGRQCSTLSLTKAPNRRIKQTRMKYLQASHQVSWTRARHQPSLHRTA